MKFSRVLFPFCAIAAISGCAYVIPPEQNAPRSNTVVGEPHRPQLNNGSMGSSGNGVKGPQSSLTPRRAATQDVAMNDAPVQPMLPPVDAATQAQAQQEMAQMPASMPAPLPVTTPPANDRHVPLENQKFEVSANDSYPSLKTVPPRPAMTGPESSKARLSEVQQDLQQDRANAQASKDTLSRDAAAEPSLLAPMPKTDTVVPPNAPVSMQPTVTPVGTVIVPPKETVRTIPLTPGASIAPITPAHAQVTFNALPAPTPVVSTASPQPAPRITMPAATYAATTPNLPTFAPPAPMNAAAMPAPRAVNATPVIAAQDLPAPMPTGAVPVVTAKAQPTVKKGDFDPLAAADNVPVVAATAPAPSVKKGDFDPLAAADNAPIVTSATTTVSSNAPTAYGNQGYLAASRYADRRY